VCPFSGDFLYDLPFYRCYKGLKTSTLFWEFRLRYTDAFHRVVPNDNFYAFKTPNLTHFAVKNASWQIWLRIEIG